MRPLFLQVGILAVLLLATPSSPSVAAPDGDSATPLRHAARLEETSRLLREQRWVSVDSLARIGLREVERSGGADSREAGRFLIAILEASRRLGRERTPEVRDMAGRALRIAEATFPPRSTELATACSRVAQVVLGNEGSRAALPLARRALALREALQGPDHTEIAAELVNLGIIHLDLRDWGACAEVSRRAISMLERLGEPNHRNVGAALTNLGAALAAEGWYDEGIVALERSVTVKRLHYGADHPRILVSLGNIAALQRLAGNLPAAVTLTRRVAEAQARQLGERHHELVGTYGNLGDLLFELGDHEGALEYHRRGLAIADTAHARDSSHRGALLISLGRDLAGLGRHDEARAQYTSALSLFRGKADQGGTYYIDALKLLADLEFEAGSPARGDQWLAEALELARSALHADHPAVPGLLVRRGRRDLERGRPGDAQSSFAEAERRLRGQRVTSGETLAELLDGQARLQELRGNTAAAIDSALRAEALSRERFRHTVRVLPERIALAFSARRPRSLDFALRLLAKDGPGRERAAAVLDEVIASRALVFDEMAERRRMLSILDSPDVDSLMSQLSAAQSRLANLELREVHDQPAETVASLIHRTRSEKERLEAELGTRSSAIRDARARSRTGYAEVQRALGPDDALLSYVRFTDGKQQGYAVFVTRGGTAQSTMVSLGDAAELEMKIATWRTSVARAPRNPARERMADEAECRAAGEALRMRLWDPVESLVAGARRVFVVADGSIHLVNFGALPSAGPTWLIERDPVILYLSAERDLVGLPGPRPLRGGLLAIGGVDYDAAASRRVPATVRPAALAPGVRSGPGETSARHFRGNLPDCRELRSFRFESLQETRHEIDDIARHWRRSHAARPGEPTTILTKAEADEARVKQLAGTHRILHLATHGFVLGGPCADSGAGRRGIGGLAVGYPLPTSPLENPLHLSGLALSGANRRHESSPNQDDGILTAEEVASLDLTSVDWAVLSACNTGHGGVVAGEGILGLSRAFRIAGARTLIASLWPVDDAPTRAWMNALYEAHLKHGEGAAAATRNASLAVLSGRRARGESTHPFYWAAFVASGEWR